MKESVKKGFGFGLTSGVITTLGMMVGLNASTGSRTAVIGGIIAIAINEEYAMAVFNKANALANLEEYEEAIGTYKECILLEPENVLAHCYLGESLEKKVDLFSIQRHAVPLAGNDFNGSHAVLLVFRAADKPTVIACSGYSIAQRW